MSDCVLYVPMIGAREGELTAGERGALEAHLASCAACRAREADARALGPLLRDALLAEAAKRDFAPFVDGVMAKLPLSPRRAGGEGRGEGGRGILAWLDAHRRAAAAALAPVLAAAALIVYVQTRPSVPELASIMELTSEGEVTMVLQTAEGPLVLLGEENT